MDHITHSDKREYIVFLWKKQGGVSRRPGRIRIVKPEKMWYSGKIRAFPKKGMGFPHFSCPAPVVF
jgi:hypothetical protein